MKPLIVLLLILSLSPAAALAQSGRTPDYEVARDAVARGRILSLAQVLARLQASHPGRVVEVELEQDDGMPIYEIELVTRDGRLIEVKIDATNGRILELEEDDD